MINAFIQHQQAADKSVLTLKNYRCDLNGFAQWFQEANGETLRIQKITPTDLRQYKRYLNQQGYKPQTINRRLCSLKYFLEWGWEAKKIRYRFPPPKLVNMVALPRY